MAGRGRWILWNVKTTVTQKKETNTRKQSREEGVLQSEASLSSGTDMKTFWQKVVKTSEKKTTQEDQLAALVKYISTAAFSRN